MIVGRFSSLAGFDEYQRFRDVDVAAAARQSARQLAPGAQRRGANSQTGRLPMVIRLPNLPRLVCSVEFLRVSLREQFAAQLRMVVSDQAVFQLRVRTRLHKGRL